MKKAKIFINGGSQAVRLPKEYRFKEDEVIINKVGDTVVLCPKTRGWGPLLNASGRFTDDFMVDSPKIKTRK